MNIHDRIKEIEVQKDHPVIFISGLGGSGKSTFAKKLVAENTNAQLFELDWYHIQSSPDRARALKEAFESKNQAIMDEVLDPINWYDWESFEKDLLDFESKGKFHIQNAWNQKTGEKDTECFLDFNREKGLIVCEGLYLLHSPICSLSDVSILLDVAKEEARKRAEERDQHRSTPEHQARKRFIMETYDLPYFEAYQKNADFILKGNE